ncbi:helix-turn-helix domain-containing protein [Pseudophaeobacter arcticus]|uniref:helix-turn-helix domain-containing protein n=1 Tax=Pseudophaeobacter arcticus TaxID=385492 RepID=UPI003A987FD8
MNRDHITEPFLLRLQDRIESDRDLTAAGLAIKAGLDNSAIRSMLKNNASPRVATMRKICAALGTTLEEFMSNAQTSEEQEIVRLFAQLPEPLKQQLLGYGRGLAAAADQAQPKDAEEKE